MKKERTWGESRSNGALDDDPPTVSLCLLAHLLFDASPLSVFYFSFIVLIYLFACSNFAGP